MATPQVTLVHDTVYVAVHDTLRMVVPAPHETTLLERVLTVVGIIVVPLVAAWIGAREGAKRADKTAMALHAATIKAEKDARDQEHEAHEVERVAERKANKNERDAERQMQLQERAAERDRERDERAKQMLERVTRVLKRVAELGERLPATNDFGDLATRGAEMRILWSSFERQSGDLYLVGTPELRDQIEAFIGGLQSTVAGTEAALGDLQDRKTTAMMGSRMSGDSPININTAHDPKAILDAFREKLSANKEEAERLLGLLLT